MVTMVTMSLMLCAIIFFHRGFSTSGKFIIDVIEKYRYEIVKYVIDDILETRVFVKHLALSGTTALNILECTENHPLFYMYHNIKLVRKNIWM